MAPQPARRRIVITAGGTAEPIDDVRAITNASTGRLGLALARGAASRGHQVVLLAGPAARARLDRAIPGVQVVPFTDHTSLAAALDDALSTPVDAVLMAAAVADYAPAKADGKIRSTQDTMTLVLHRTPKLLDTLRDRAPEALLVGFKLLSGVDDAELVRVARAQNQRAQLDATLANDASRLSDAGHPALWVTDDAVLPLQGSRDEVADRILDQVLGPSPTALHLPGVPAPALRPRGRARVWRWLERAQAAPVRSDPEGVHASLASLPSAPRWPFVTASGHWGQGEADAFESADRWARLGGDGALPLIWDGRLVGACRLVDGVCTVRTVGDDDDVWPQALLPTLPAAQWHFDRSDADGMADPLDGLSDAPAPVAWRFDDPTRWAHRGFRKTPEGTWVAPWDRDDTRSAASAALVHRPTRRVLLGTRTTGPHPGRLAFPGGSIEPGELPQVAARRELAEETLTEAPEFLPFGQWVVWQGADPCWRIHCAAWWVVDAIPPQPTPTFSARWVDVDDALADPRTLPGVHRVLVALRAELDRTP